MSRTTRFTLLLLLLSACALSATAQQAAPPSPLPPAPFEPLTRLEALDTQIGTVLVKNYTHIGSVSGFGGIVMVTSYEFVDGQSGRKEYGIGIELRETGRSEREGRAYIDYDEIDALLRAIDYIIKIERSATMENFEAQYRTRGEFAVATFIRPNGTLQAEVSIGLFRRAGVNISLGKLADFRKLIADSKTTLDKLR
jgi:hypothetical protein